MPVLLYQLEHGFLVFLQALLIALIPYLIVYIERVLKVQKSANLDTFNAQMNASISAAVSRGAGIAYNALAVSGKDFTDPIVHNTAIAAGLNHVISSIPDTLAAMGVTQDGVIRMVTGELGKLLAVDPNVTVASYPPVATTTNVANISSTGTSA